MGQVPLLGPGAISSSFRAQPGPSPLPEPGTSPRASCSLRVTRKPPWALPLFHRIWLAPSIPVRQRQGWGGWLRPASAAGAAASSAPSLRSTPVLCLPGGPGGQRGLLKGALLGAGRVAACGWAALCSQAAVPCFVSQWQRHAGVHSVRTLTPGSRCSEELPRLPPGLRLFSSSALAGLFLGFLFHLPLPFGW